MSAAHSTAHRQHYTPPPAQPAERQGDAPADHSHHARAALAAVYIFAAIVLGAILTGALP